MRVAFEKALGETQLLLNTGSHGAGDNVAVELELLLHGGPECGGDLLRAGFGGCAICGAIIVVIVAVAGHGCGGGLGESWGRGRGGEVSRVVLAWRVGCLERPRRDMWGSHSATCRVNDSAMSNMDDHDRDHGLLHCPLPRSHCGPLSCSSGAATLGLGAPPPAC